MKEEKEVNIPTMAGLAAENKQAEYLFWVGSAGCYDDRAKKITRAFAKILIHCRVNFAVLGTEETDSGDVARRAGNEFLFQMQAMQNIETMKMYNVRKIITCDPHDYNTIKNEYPDLGGNYEILHHTEFIYELLLNKKLEISKSPISQKILTYHDPCYLARGNDIVEQPRKILLKLSEKFIEMRRNGKRSLCCGAGGAQMFKETEKGKTEIYMLRTKEALELNPEIIVTACPFCMTMLRDGINMHERQSEVQIYDIAELIVIALGI
ncbi:MAG: (Fe-S)-binding protein [Bacteroidales bacterium]